MHPLLPYDRPRLSSRARLQSDRVTGKPIILYPEGVLILNPTGRAIVALCTGENAFIEILAKLSQEFGTSPEALSCEVSDYLNRLRAKNLLEVSGSAE